MKRTIWSVSGWQRVGLAVVASAFFSLVSAPSVLAASGYSWGSAGGSLPSFCLNLSASADGKYMACANSNGGDIAISSDYGATWIDHTGSPGSQNWQDIAVSSTGKYMLAAVAGDLFYSSDFGATWSDLSAAGSHTWKYAAISADGQRLAAVLDNNEVALSSNAGASWTFQAISGAAAIYSVAMSTDGKYIYADDINTDIIYVSNNFGSTWTNGPHIATGVMLKLFTLRRPASTWLRAIPTAMSTKRRITASTGRS